MCTASAPDVCKVPGPPPAPFTPTPFPNMGQCMQGSSTSSKVKICGKETMTTSSEISMSNGDEAGVMKGMISQTNMDKITYKAGSASVQAEGNPIVMSLKPTGHNSTNANAPPGAQVAPSQTSVIIGS